MGINCMGVTSGGRKTKTKYVKSKIGKSKLASIQESGARSNDLATHGKLVFKRKKKWIE